MAKDATESESSESFGSTGRLEDLYIRNAPGALRLAYFLTGNREVAEDLVQEAFVRVAGRFAHLRVPDAFDAYLRRTIVNLFTSQLRRAKLERAYIARHGAPPPEEQPEDPAARGELWRALHRLPRRQRAINGISITYPERWFASDPITLGIEPNDAPPTLPTLVLALTRDDPRIRGILGCPSLADVPGQVLMTVQETPLALSGEASAAWPVPLVPMDLGAAGQDVGCYAGWTIMRAAWTAAGRSFEARVGIAADASEADRAALARAYESMSFAPGSVAPGESVSLGSGTAFGTLTWRLDATRDGGNICWTLQTDTVAFGACPADAAPKEPSIQVQPVPPDGAFALIRLPSDVRSAVVETGGEAIGDVGLLPVPGAWGDVAFAVVPLPGSGDGTVRFQGSAGNDIFPAASITWSGDVWAEPTPPAGTADGELPWQVIGTVLTARGEMAGTSWKVETLYYRDGVRLTIGGRPEELGVLRIDEPIVRPMGTSGSGALVLVLTNLSVDRVAVEAPGGTWVGRWIPASTGTGGKARLWVVEAPGTGDGTLLLNERPVGRVSLP